VVINPYGMYFGNTSTGIVGQGYFPFLSNSTSNTNLVYNGATISSGPFNSQTANVEGHFPDQLKVSFMCTQSALNAQGKVTASVFYTYPNISLTPTGAYTFDGTLAAITAA